MLYHTIYILANLHYNKIFQARATLSLRTQHLSLVSLVTYEVGYKLVQRNHLFAVRLMFIVHATNATETFLVANYVHAN